MSRPLTPINHGEHRSKTFPKAEGGTQKAEKMKILRIDLWTWRGRIDRAECATPPVVAFRELPPPEDWVFHAGVAYPVRAPIDGHGAGALRHCVFSTGAFEEPIEIWDEPRLLKFSVASQPARMRVPVAGDCKGEDTP